jgi:hypothetical protein
MVLSFTDDTTPEFAGAFVKASSPRCGMRLLQAGGWF